MNKSRRDITTNTQREYYSYRHHRSTGHIPTIYDNDFTITFFFKGRILKMKSRPEKANRHYRRTDRSQKKKNREKYIRYLI